MALPPPMPGACLPSAAQPILSSAANLPIIVLLGWRAPHPEKSSLRTAFAATEFAQDAAATGLAALHLRSYSGALANPSSTCNLSVAKLCSCSQQYLVHLSKKEESTHAEKCTATGSAHRNRCGSRCHMRNDRIRSRPEIRIRRGRRCHPNIPRRGGALGRSYWAYGFAGADARIDHRPVWPVPPMARSREFRN